MDIPSRAPAPTARSVSPPPLDAFLPGGKIPPLASEASARLTHALEVSAELARDAEVASSLASTLRERISGIRPPSTPGRVDLVETEVDALTRDMAMVSTLVARTNEGLGAIAEALRAFPTLPVNEDYLREMMSTLDKLRELYQTTWRGICEQQTAVLWYRDQLARAALDAQTINARLDAFPHECAAAVQHVADTALRRVSVDIQELARVIRGPLEMLVTILAQPATLPDDVITQFSDMVRVSGTALAEIATCARRHTESALERQNSLLAHDVINLRSRIAALPGSTRPSVEDHVALRDLWARVEQLEAGQASQRAPDIEADVKAHLEGLGPS